MKQVLNFKCPQCGHDTLDWKEHGTLYQQVIDIHIMGVGIDYDLCDPNMDNMEFKGFYCSGCGELFASDNKDLREKLLALDCNKGEA